MSPKPPDKILSECGVLWFIASLVFLLGIMGSAMRGQPMGVLMAAGMVFLCSQRYRRFKNAALLLKTAQPEPCIGRLRCRQGGIAGFSWWLDNVDSDTPSTPEKYQISCFKFPPSQVVALFSDFKEDYNSILVKGASIQYSAVHECQVYRSADKPAVVVTPAGPLLLGGYFF
ncbi:MAG: hypothetical protein K2W95_29805 [Candidatus Obscuribacterales bacterium]|nr:hypothetical protein [Candidatus Obscuribacterales bacterium]